MRIATPCHEDWGLMDPRRSGRHCAACDKTVVDLAALTLAERRTRLAVIAGEVRAGRPVCVRGAVDRDGALAGSRRALNGGMAMLLAMTMAGCMGDGPQLAHPEPMPVHVTRPADTGEAVDPIASSPVDPVVSDGPVVESQARIPSHAVGEVVGEAEMPQPILPELGAPMLMGAIACPPPDPRMPRTAN